MPLVRVKEAKSSTAVVDSSNSLKDDLRKRMMLATYGEDYEDREKTIAKILHDKLNYFQGLDLSVILPESHTIINKYAGYIMDFKVKISFLNIKSTIDDLGNSLGGISTEQKLKIALDRIKGTLANRYVNHKSDEDIDKDKLIGILRMKHDPNTRSAEYKKKNKNVVVLLDACLVVVRSNKKFSFDQFKAYLREIPKDMLVSELQDFIVKNR
jgi:hypothetical protein